jgi:hypothetical protein
MEEDRARHGADAAAESCDALTADAEGRAYA